MSTSTTTALSSSLISINLHTLYQHQHRIFNSFFSGLLHSRLQPNQPKLFCPSTCWSTHVFFFFLSTQKFLTLAWGNQMKKIESRTEPSRARHEYSLVKYNSETKKLYTTQNTKNGNEKKKNVYPGTGSSGVS